MIDKLQELRQAMDEWASSMSTAIRDLRSEMKVCFEEQRQIIDEQQRAIQQLQQTSVTHGRAILRQAASFDQSMAKMEETFEDHRGNVGVIWDAVFTKLGSVEELQEQNKDIIRRLEAVEKKLAS